LLESLLLEESWLGEAESDLVSGQLVVAVSDGGDLALHDLLVKWVQEDLLVLLALKVDPDLPSSDMGWEAHVAEDLLVHGVKVLDLGLI
jgi:hypothetical protein